LTYAIAIWTRDKEGLLENGHFGNALSEGTVVAIVPPEMEQASAACLQNSGTNFRVWRILAKLVNVTQVLDGKIL